MKAVVYARISRDRAGAGLGIERQEADCRALAARDGHEVMAVIPDNDLTAYKAAHRPGFEELMTRMEAGEFDVVLAWHTDRLYRDNIDLERLIDICDRRNIPVQTVKAGALDLSTASGRMAARIYCAVQKHEVEHAIERIKAAKLQSAKAGKFSGGQRPFGYEKGCKAIREDEAVIYKEMVEHVLDGWSFGRVADDLNERGITTQHSKIWRSVNVRNLLLHARYAGIREHNGTHYPAQWPAIIGKETWDDLQVAIRLHAAQFKRPGPGKLRKNLVTGLAYCGRCGKRMNTSRRQRRDGSYEGVYVCVKRDAGNGPGCGRMRRIIAAVDLLVAEAIIYRLESDNFDQALNEAANQDDSGLRELVRRRSSQQDRIDEIRDDYATGELTKIEYKSLIQAAQSRLAELERQIDQLAPTRARGPLPASHLARQAWEAADLKQRRIIADTLIEKIEIMPSDPSGLFKGQYFMGHKFIPKDVVIRWKL